MIRIFIDSLVSPKENVKHSKLPWWKILIFFMILVLLSLLPSLVSTILNDHIDTSQKNLIRSAFQGKDVPFVIEDGVLKKKEDSTIDALEVSVSNQIYLKISVEEEQWNSKFQINLFMVSDGVYMVSSGRKTKILNYMDFPMLQNIDLSRAKNRNDITFWNHIFSVVDQIIKDHHVLTIIVMNAFYIVYWGFWLTFLSFSFSIFCFLRMGKYLKLTEIWRANIFSLTPFVMGVLFSSFFGFTFCIYLGGLVSAIYSLIAGKQLFVDKVIDRRK